MHYCYKTKGTCATKIDFDLEGDTVTNVQFTSGCNGNLSAISCLIDGLSVDEIVSKLKGISCGGRPTSCSDQLATALLQAIDETKS